MTETKDGWRDSPAMRTAALIPVATTFAVAAVFVLVWFQGDYPIWLLTLPACQFVTATMALRGRLPAPPTTPENQHG